MLKIYSVIEFRNGILVGAESFENKIDAQDHFVGVARGRGVMESKEIENGHFAVVKGSETEKLHVVYFVETTL